MRAYKWIVETCFLGLFLTACCGAILLKPNVDVTPLKDLLIPPNISQVTDIIDTGIFDEYEIQDSGKQLIGKWTNPDSGSFAGMWVLINIIPDIETRRYNYYFDCNFLGKPYKTGGEDDNLYCISYIKRFRLPPDAFCKPSNNYSSSVAFRKNQIIIVIHDDLANTDKNRMSDVIKSLAIEIEKHLPH